MPQKYAASLGSLLGHTRLGPWAGASLIIRIASASQSIRNPWLDPVRVERVLALRTAWNNG